MSSLSEPDGERYGQFPSVLSLKTPLGMREQLRAAAAVEKISVGEFVRRALGEALVGKNGAEIERAIAPWPDGIVLPVAWQRPAEASNVGRQFNGYNARALRCTFGNAAL
jgi:hypothetical protein